MNAPGLIETIAPILYRYKDKGSIRSANGSEFICKIDGAPRRFLHRLYKGSEDTALKIAELWGKPLPASYREFLTRLNGATLFDNSFSIFGLPEEFNRSPSFEDEHALPINHLMEDRRLLDPARALIELPVASVLAANELFDADLRLDGSITLRDERGNAREFASFADFAGSICMLLDNLSDENGLRDDSCEELQHEMIEFISLSS
jgi:hypothetical protein